MRKQSLIDYLSRLTLCMATSFLAIASNPSYADEPSAGTVRIGILTLAHEKVLARYLKTFQEELKGYGYVKGNNLEIEARWGNGDLSRLDHLAEELVRARVNLLVATTTYDVRAAKKATSAIPIVMIGPADPVATGLVASLAFPGTNVTGLSALTPELSIKRLQIIKETLPGIARVAVLSNPDHPIHATIVENITSAAAGASLQAFFVLARTSEQLPGALRAARRAHAQALLVVEDPLFYLRRAEISQLAMKERLPAIYAAREYAEVGGLLSYGPNYEDLWRRAAGVVDKILKGVRPSAIPIEQPMTFDFVVNAKSARILGLTIPESTLMQATVIIK